MIWVESFFVFLAVEVKRPAPIAEVGGIEAAVLFRGEERFVVVIVSFIQTEGRLPQGVHGDVEIFGDRGGPRTASRSELSLGVELGSESRR